MADKVVVPGTEQVGTSAPPPAPVTKTQEPSEPSNFHEAIEAFKKDQAKASEKPAAVPEKVADKGEASPLGKKETLGKEREKKEEESKAKDGPKIPFSIHDEKGNIIPFKADGKDYVPESLEQLRTWVSMGIHANTALEGVKSEKAQIAERVKELEKAEGQLNEIMSAIASGKIESRDGKLIVAPQRQGAAPGESGAPQPPEEEDVFASPESKEIKSLKSELVKLKQDFRSMSMDRMDEKVRGFKDVLDREIEANRKQSFMARDKDIWDLLALVEKNGQPTYTPETAMKFLHEQELGRLKTYAKEHPEIIGKDEVIAEYLREKAEKESAPVQGPADTAAPSPSAAPKKEFDNLGDAARAFVKDHGTALLAKQTF